MSDLLTSSSSRREFLKDTGKVAAATTLLAAAAPHVHAGEDNTIRIALVGAGGRGTGAAANALSVENGPIELVAIADVVEKNLSDSYNNLTSKFGDRVNVPEDQKFIGFDGYKKAMDCLRPGDVVILTTPPGFRWVHYTYAIDKGLNVFMEKPVTVDGPTTRRMLELNKQALEKNLKVGVGLMCRHCEARQELFDRIQNGEIGDVNMLRAYRVAGPTGSAEVPPMPAGEDELLYQIANFHGFLFLSGGAVSDFLIHNIDESCWMKNDWPVKAIGFGGRHYRGDNVDQNFDTYSIEYTFADGAKLFVDGRTIPGCYNDFASYAHGSKGLAVISTASHTRPRAASTRATTRTQPTCNGPIRSLSGILISSNGTTSSRPSAKTVRTTRSTAVRWPAWSRRWGAWPPTRVRRSLSIRSSTPITSLPPRSTRS
ncbi:MAG: gfo/Idh/MocA family oxidoreductase [Pirellulales bacterium]